MRRSDRYLVSQLTTPSLIGMFTFAVILLGDVARQLGAALMGSRVPIPLLAEYLACHLPYAISWAMPVGMVVGVAMTVTALTNHGEITALRAGGHSIARIARGFVLTGLLASAVSFALGEYMAPPAGRKARELFAQIGLSQPVMTEQYNVFFRDAQTGDLYHVGHMDPATNQLERITIWEPGPDERPTGITTAEWAEVRGRRWYLRQGVSVRLGPDGQQQGPPLKFREQKVMLWKALQDYYSSRRSSFEMSAGELGDVISVMGPAGKDTHREQVQYHFKYSIPLACLVFALCAVPISFRMARHGSFVGVVVAVIVVFLYNGVRSWTLAFGLAGNLDPLIAGWLPDALFGALGVTLLLRTR